MTTLASIDHETGNLSAYTAQNVAGTGATLTAYASAAKNGSWGMRAYKPTGSDNGYAQGEKAITFPASNVLSLQCWMYIAAASAASGMLTCPYMWGNANTIMRLVIFNGNWIVGLRKKDGTETAGSLSMGNLATLTWYQIELVYDKSGAQPAGSCYVNGSLQWSGSDATAGTNLTPDTVGLGAWETSWAATGDIYYDDLLVSDVVQAGAPAASTLRNSGIMRGVMRGMR